MSYPFTPSSSPYHWWGETFTVNRLMGWRHLGRGLQYLVEWEGYGPEERSWTPARFILDKDLIKDFHKNHPVPPIKTPRGASWGGGGGTVNDSVSVYLFLFIWYSWVCFATFWWISCILSSFDYRMYVYMWFEPEHNPSPRLTFRLFPGLLHASVNLPSLLVFLEIPAATLFALNHYLSFTL